MFSYATVEAALATNLKVDTNGRPAFAARLRHLRNLGIPRATPGTGRRLSYSIDDVQQMLIALLLESIDCSPRASADIARSVTAGGRPFPEIIAVLPHGKAVSASVERLLMLLRAHQVLAVMNLSRAFANLDEALQKALVKQTGR